MRRTISLRRIFSVAVVSGVLVVVSAVATPVQSPESGKPATAVENNASGKQLQPQTTCPVMGGEINKSIFVDVKGKRIYACCAGCLDAIKKDPDKYIQKLAGMGQSVESIGEVKTESAAGPEKTAIKKDAVAGDTSKKRCAMMGDSSKKKCPMMSDTSKVKGCYTCPMHPEVMQKGPGKCPKCGMDLVFQTCKMDGKGKGGCCKMKKQD